MLSVLCAVAWAAMLPSGAGNETPALAFLTSTRVAADGRIVQQVESYVPQEGDLILFHEHVDIWDILFRVVGSGPPDHSGVMFRLPDGRLAILEAAPENGKGGYILRVCLMEAQSRFISCKGTILIRRLRCPLTPAQSAQLTNFALAQQGKRYAVGRLLRQFTPLKARGPKRVEMLGKTYLNRRTWICSELVVAGYTTIGLMNPAQFPANAIYPLDLLEDTNYDLSATWYSAEIWRSRAMPTMAYGEMGSGSSERMQKSAPIASGRLQRAQNDQSNGNEEE